MTKAVEPYTDEELARLRSDNEKSLYREKLAHVQGLANRRGIRATQNMRAWHRTRAALEAAEARVSELEKAMEPFVRVGNMLTEYPSGSAILYQASGDPSMNLTSDHCHAAVAAMFPTPPEEEDK